MRDITSGRWMIVVLVVISILSGLVYYYPVLTSGSNLGIQDWDQEFAWTEFNRMSMVEFHQIPFWNPYKCGGTVQFGNPQIPVISLQTLFALLFGTVRGIKLSIFFHGVIGFIGFYFLAKQYKLSNTGSLLAAILFSYSGITGSFLSTGMVVFTSFAYSPYILFFFNKSFDNIKWVIISGILFAICFYYGYQIPLLLGVYLLIYVLITCIVKRTFIPIKALAIMLITSVILMLPKLLLSIELLQIYPRILPDESGFSINNFFYFLLSLKQNLFGQMDAHDYTYSIDENSIYVGLISVVLFLSFFVRNRKGIRNSISLVITLLIFIWLMLGTTINPSLYWFIRHLPVMSSFRVAQRFRFDFIIPFSLIVGLGFDNYLRILKDFKFARLISFISLLIISIDLALFSSNNFLSKTLIIENPEQGLSRQTAFIQTTTNRFDYEIKRTIQLPMESLTSNIFIPWSDEYLKILQNQGELVCYDPIPIKVFAVGMGDDKYRGEYYLLNSVNGIKIENTFWSPNELVYTITDVGKSVNDILVINQNFYPGWIVTKNNEACSRAINQDGLLATELSSSDSRISFEFNPIRYYSLCR